MGNSETLRKIAYKNSDLPPSFDYKIRKAFTGLPCPICGARMGIRVLDECGIWFPTPSPSIQHNIPISKGGKHELSNISVICLKCNTSIKENITGELNNALVQAVWRLIYGK